MSAKQHPDYQQEQAYLQSTRTYIQQVLKEARQSGEEFQENIWEAFANLNSLDSSLGYTSLLTNVQFLEMVKREQKQLERVQNRPYFARVDFQDTTQSRPEPLYIGKVSLYDRYTQKNIIVDWRSPVANVYYDGRIGYVSYEVGDEVIEGDISLKRQYIIEEGELQEIRDIDITTHDDLLQEALSGSAQNRLTDIVSTIQEEQNRIIRADLYRPLIVQGVAGSGKTTIALHRIAYFIYKHAQHFSPQSIMILAPSKLFLTYISEVLPELGVDQVQQKTFLDFVRECVDEKLAFTRMDQDLVPLLSGIKEREEVVAFKGSLQYARMVQQYAKDVEKALVPQEDFKIGSITVMRQERIRKLFLHEYKYLPVYRRMEKLKNVLQNYVRTKKKELEERILERYEVSLEKALAIQNDEKRKEMVTRVMEKKEALLEEFKRECRTAANAYMKKFHKRDIYSYYEEFLTDGAVLRQYGPQLSEELSAELQASRLPKKRSYRAEDAAALLYLQHYLYGTKVEVKTKSVVIDEAQDYTMFEMYALKKVCRTELFTILGDLSQGIHSYRGIGRWEKLQQQLFPQASYMTLEKSYRTTIEIMNLANHVLSSYCEVKVPLAVPVVRHGRLPECRRYETDGELAAFVEDMVRTGKEAKLKSFALLGKTKEECERVVKVLEKYSLLPVQLMTEQQELDHDFLSVIPVHVAKGLEFDCVGIVSYHEAYQPEELDAQLLYVGMTRPLHRLHVYAKEPGAVLLGSVPEGLLSL
ncbi:RNA polymerase recycling motor HelD [Ectobacillus ponti]|uniref:AAA family ATPase n=1 Tax=Ectobacillus ponti TaxID=2961894 RepID=A0AA42BTH2_9BACI|nr:RNA polymerase recycling motor HelD [Ectobacillus ponti]MCP8969478.1 AAA family ATPase [Ectobacillus ponti]